MPELPEVETYVRELEPLLSGRQILAAEVRWGRTIAGPSPEEFVARIAGQRFSTFGRRLHYQDPRKFGRMWLTSQPELVLRKLGPEPLSDAFSGEELAGKLAGRKAAIKALLLDQALAAGVGNIYADEALFRAGLHPLRPGGSLTPGEVERLRQAVAAVLTAGIAAAGSSLGGSSLQNYSRPGGQTGSFQEEHRVFRRTGQPCLTCGAPIERIVVGQRSTHFCPNCQPSEL